MAVPSHLGRPGGSGTLGSWSDAEVPPAGHPPFPTASTDMPAALPHRPSAASTDARRPSANPWKVDLRELGRRAGSMQEIERKLPAPAGWRVELIGVPEGADVGLRLRLESVMEGVLVTGEADVPLAGSCARCLEPIEDSL